MNQSVRRRNFIVGYLTLLTLGAPAALAQSAAVANSEDYKDFFSPDLPDLVAQGTDPALAPEVQKASELISKAPPGRKPLDVMLYFEALTDKNVANEFYNAGWRKRWNPVIVTFFNQTRTKPSGDVTPWCAASLNWCLFRSGYRTTASALSGSFRNSPGITTSPKPGDIAVFRNTDPAEAQVGRGHVAFFLEESGDSVYVVGGNQKNNFGHHAICRKWLSKRGSVLTLDSYHSIDAFQPT